MSVFRLYCARSLLSASSAVLTAPKSSHHGVIAALNSRTPLSHCIAQLPSSVRHFSVDSFFASVSNSSCVAHFQDGLVRLHDTTGLPWWASIILSTVLFRTVITLPLTIYQHRITARLEQISAEMPKIVAELKQEAAVARRQFRWNEAETRRVYNRSVKKQWDALVVRENCHPLKTFCVVWGQIPLWIVQSMALRNLLAMQPDPSVLQAQLTFTELTLGGCAWFPNLTEVDASLVMPIALGLLNLVIIEVTQTTNKLQKCKTIS